MGTVIKQIEYYFPEKEVNNKYLSNIFPEYDFLKFEKKVGIKRRYVVDQKTTAFDLAVCAVEKLFSKKEFLKDEIDYLIYCTQSPEYFLPTTACLIQNKCGLKKNIGAIDINQGCSGYTYCLGLAQSLLVDDNINNILIVTSETYSKYINEKDKTNRSIFGDAATATIISSDEKIKNYKFLYGTDGSGANSLIVKNGCSIPYDNNPKEKSYGRGNRYTDNNLYMDGPEVFNFTLREIPSFFEKIVVSNKINIKDIDQIIFHQANKFLLNTLRRLIKIEKDKFYINLEDGGNTVSNTIPIALKKYVEENNLYSVNLKFLLIGFGVGLSWGGGVINTKILNK